MREKNGGISRRRFLELGAGAVSVGAIAGLTGCASSGSSGQKDYLPKSWDAEADILVVGCGGAGISAAITAASEALGDCLVLEAAPEGEEGGNTRVSAQVVFCPSTVEGAVKYQANLNGPYKIDEDLMQAWAENICENYEWLSSVGIVVDETTFFSPEWPDVEGSEACRCYLKDGKLGNERLWNELASTASDQGVTIQYDTRVTELICNPETGEVLGVKSDDGRSFKARKGVLLSCGGFENNPDMVANYYQVGYYETRPLGTPYNRGDGVLMAQSAGAELWHMNNFANNGFGIASGDMDNPCVIPMKFSAKDYIYVGPDGKRFMYEEEIGLSRHGKALYGGASTNFRQPVPVYAVFGQQCFDAGCIPSTTYIDSWNVILKQSIGNSNAEFLKAGTFVSAETPEDLAKKIGFDASVFEKTISSYNQNAANGSDPDYGRGREVFSPFNQAAQAQASAAGQSSVANQGAEKPAIEAFPLVPIKGPYYAVRLYTATLNTQGGPKRSALGEVVSAKGKPIPRLFAAGELGAIYPYNYNGGGNVSEALSSGRLAARQIATLSAWDAKK
ncbi:MAG: FAD-dependent oxidoreductase [Raoultibacter sp.]